MTRGQPEFELQCVIADLLRWGVCKNVYWTAFPADEERPKKLNKRGQWYSPAGERLKRKGVKDGVADLLFLVRGKPVAIELKADKHGRQTKNQEDFQTEWEAAGGDYYLLKGYEATVEKLEWLRIIRPVKGSARFEPRVTAA